MTPTPMPPAPTDFDSAWAFFREHHGMSLTPVPLKSKAPKLKDWNRNLDATRGDFNLQAKDQAGLMLGAPVRSIPEYRLYDVDIDANTDWARKIVAYSCPETGWVFGRKGKPNSHRLYVAREVLDSKSYTDLTGGTALELRGMARGEKHTQTVAPGGVHASGEDIRFVEPIGMLPKVDGPALARSVQLAAVAIVIAQCWPLGERHKACLCWSSVLKNAGVTEMECRLILEAVTDAMESEPWNDARTCARDTYAAKVDDPQLGAGWIRENLTKGAEAVALIQKHLGVQKVVALAEARDKFSRYFVSQVGGRKRQTMIGDERVFPPAFMSFEAFRNLYSNTEVFIDRQRTTEADLWLRDRKRRQYDRVEFVPPPHQADADIYNLWKGYSVEPDPDPHPEERCALWLAHVRDVICDGDGAVADFLLDVLAAKVQKPGELTEVAIVTRSSTHGTGKNSFVEPFLQLFGHHGVLLDKADLAVGRFNASLSSKVAVALDEALWPGHKEFTGALKSWVTNRVIMIEYKGIDAAPEPNYAQIFVMTNREWAWPAEETDRRALVLDVPPTRVGDRAYFDALHAEQVKGGPGQRALLAYLLARPVTSNLRAIPPTKALGRQKDLSLPLELEWWHECLVLGEIEEQPWPAKIASVDLYFAYLAYAKAHHAKRVLSQIEFGMKLRDYLLPPGQKTRGVRPKVPALIRDQVTRRILLDTTFSGPQLGRKVDGWDLPDLATARQRWDAARKQVTDWEELVA